MSNNDKPLCRNDIVSFMRKLGIEVPPEKLERKHGGKFILHLPVDAHNAGLIVRRLHPLLGELSPRYELIVSCNAVLKSNDWRRRHGIEISEEENVKDEELRAAV